MVELLLITLTRVNLEEEAHDPYNGEDNGLVHCCRRWGIRGLRSPVILLSSKRMAPHSLRWSLDQLPDQGGAWDLKLTALANQMVQDGLLRAEPPHGKSTFRVFAKHQN